jgi:hypothetical protein
MFSIMRKVSKRGPRWTLSVAALSAALSFVPAVYAQDEEDEEDELDDLGEKPSGTSDEAEEEDSATAEKPSSSVKVETGAPRPPAQTPGIAPAAPAAGTPPPAPTIKVGGGMILAYFHPYNMATEAREQFRPEPKPNFETFRAAILLDSKIDRFGVHIEFRARDKRVREFYEGTSWLEEIYGSVDIMKADNPLGSAVLKVGKSYAQFGRFWDDSFYGNVHLRDGLKLDPNYGLSLEGQIGKGQLGAKYFGQYFIIDGGTNTSLNTRDTISNTAPFSGYPPSGPAGGAPAVSLARRRNMFVGRIEPFFAINPTTVFKIAGSIENFTADFGPTLDQENVIRYGGDITANVAWFGAWAEFTQQKGNHTRTHPFAPTPATPLGANPFRPGMALEAAPGGFSKDVQYLLAGGRFFYKGIMLRYNFNSAKYNDVTVPLGATTLAALRSMRIPQPVVDIKEHMHVPGIMITATQQLFLMIEAPIHKRHIPKILTTAARDLVLDRSIVVTLHARI